MDSANKKKFNNCAIVSIDCRLRLHLLKGFSGGSGSLDNCHVRDTFQSIRDSLQKECQIKVKQSTKMILNHPKIAGKLAQSQSETLYDSWDIPLEVSQLGDYLPQMSKVEKEKESQKWRNKQKNKREQIDFVISHPNFTPADNESKGVDGEYVIQELNGFAYLPMNNFTIAQSVQLLLEKTIKLLDAVEASLLRFCVGSEEKFYQVKTYTFRNIKYGLVDFVYVAYPDPATFDNKLRLEEYRRELHEKYNLPIDRPLLRPSQQFYGRAGKPEERDGYLCNVHIGLPDAPIKGGARIIIDGTYTYHHYMQEKINDKGWGCAYRSLQTIVSWYKHQGYLDDYLNIPGLSVPPSHNQIQQSLVDIGDKPNSFVDSHKWIGSQEVCYVLSQLYKIESKIISVNSGSELVYKARELAQHFETQSTPVMIGGGVLAHTIIGVDFNEKSGEATFLVLDPHYTGPEDLTTIQKKGWCGWKKPSFWDKNSFYNLCLPQLPVVI